MATNENETPTKRGKNNTVYARNSTHIHYFEFFIKYFAQGYRLGGEEISQFC